MSETIDIKTSEFCVDNKHIVRDDSDDDVEEEDRRDEINREESEEMDVLVIVLASLVSCQISPMVAAFPKIILTELYK